MILDIKKFEQLNTIAKSFFKIIFILGFVDFISFIAWTASGQVPIDGFYMGAITYNIIDLFLF